MFTRLSTALTALLMTTTSLTAMAQEESEPTSAPDAALSLLRVTAAHGVQDRLPVGEDAPFFANGERLYIYVEVANPEGPESTVLLNWSHDGEVAFNQTLDIGQSRTWRTWGYHRMSASTAGLWHVDVVDADGDILGSVDFSVAPGSDNSSAPSAQTE